VEDLERAEHARGLAGRGAQVGLQSADAAVGIAVCEQRSEHRLGSAAAAEALDPAPIDQAAMGGDERARGVDVDHP
jgi:hypothetical protein